MLSTVNRKYYQIYGITPYLVHSYRDIAIIVARLQDFVPNTPGFLGSYAARSTNLPLEIPAYGPVSFYDIINNVRSSTCDQYSFQNLYVMRFFLGCQQSLTCPINAKHPTVRISFRISLHMTSAHMANSLQIFPIVSGRRGKIKSQ